MNRELKRGGFAKGQIRASLIRESAEGRDSGRTSTIVIERLTGNKAVDKDSGFRPIELTIGMAKTEEKGQTRNDFVLRNKVILPDYQVQSARTTITQDLSGLKTRTSAQVLIEGVIDAFGRGSLDNPKDEVSDAINVNFQHMPGLATTNEFENLRENDSSRRTISSMITVSLAPQLRQELGEEADDYLATVVEKAGKVGYLKGAVGTNAGLITRENDDDESGSVVLTHASFMASEEGQRTATETGIVSAIDTSKRESSKEKLVKTGKLYSRIGDLPEGVETYEAAGNVMHNIINVISTPGTDAGSGGGIGSSDLMNLQVRTESRVYSKPLDRGFNLAGAVFDGAGQRGRFDQSGGLLMRDGERGDINTNSLRFDRMGLQGGVVETNERGQVLYDLSIGFDADSINMVEGFRSVDALKGVLGKYDENAIKRIFSLNTKKNQGLSPEAMAKLSQNDKDDIESFREIQGAIADFITNKESNQGKLADGTIGPRAILRSSNRLGGGTSGQTDISFRMESLKDYVSNKTAGMKEALMLKLPNLSPRYRAGTRDVRHAAENEAYQSLQEQITNLRQTYDNAKEGQYSMAVGSAFYVTKGRGRDKKFVLDESGNRIARTLNADQALQATMLMQDEDERRAAALKKSADDEENFLKANELFVGTKKEIRDRLTGMTAKEREQYVRAAVQSAYGHRSVKDQEKKVRKGITALSQMFASGAPASEIEKGEKYIVALSQEAGRRSEERYNEEINKYKDNDYVDPSERRNQASAILNDALVRTGAVVNSTFYKWTEQRIKESRQRITTATLDRLFANEDGSKNLSKISPADAIKNQDVQMSRYLMGAYTTRDSRFSAISEIVRAEYGDDHEAAMARMTAQTNEELEVRKRVYEQMLKAAPRVYTAGQNPRIKRLEEEQVQEYVAREGGPLTEGEAELRARRIEAFRDLYRTGSYEAASAGVLAASGSKKAIENPTLVKGQEGHRDWYWDKHIQLVDAISKDISDRAEAQGRTINRSRLDRLVYGHDLTKAVGLDDTKEDNVRKVIEEQFGKLGYSQDEIEETLQDIRDMDAIKPKKDASGRLINPATPKGMSLEAKIVSFADAASHGTEFWRIFDEQTNRYGSQAQKDAANADKVAKDYAKMRPLEEEGLLPTRTVGVESPVELPIRIQSGELVRDKDNRLQMTGDVEAYVDSIAGVQAARERAAELEMLRKNESLLLDTSQIREGENEGAIALVEASRGVSGEYTGRGRVSSEMLAATKRMYPELYEFFTDSQEGQAGMIDLVLASQINASKNDPTQQGIVDASIVDANVGKMGLVDSTTANAGQRFKAIQTEYIRRVNAERENDPDAPIREDSLMLLGAGTGLEYTVPNPTSFEGLEESAVGKAYLALVDAYNESSSENEIIEAQGVYEKHLHEHLRTKSAGKEISSIRERIPTIFDRYQADDDIADNEIEIGDRQVDLLVEQAQKASSAKVTRQDIINQINSEEGMHILAAREPEVARMPMLMRIRHNPESKHDLVKVNRFFNAYFMGDRDADPIMGAVLGRFEEDSDGKIVYRAAKNVNKLWEAQQSGRVMALARLSSGMSAAEFVEKKNTILQQSHQVLQHRLNTGFYDEKTAAEMRSQYDAKTGKVTGRYAEELRDLAFEGLIFGAEHTILDKDGKEVSIEMKKLAPKTGERYDSDGNVLSEGKDQNILAEEEEDKKKLSTAAGLMKKVKNLQYEEVPYADLQASTQNTAMAKKAMGVYNVIQGMREFMNEDAYIEMMNKGLGLAGTSSSFDELVTEEDRAKSTFAEIASPAGRAVEGMIMDYQSAIDMALPDKKVAEMSRRFSMITLDKLYKKGAGGINSSAYAYADFQAMAKNSSMTSESIAAIFGDSAENMAKIRVAVDNYRNRKNKKGEGKSSLGSVEGIVKEGYGSAYQRAMGAAAYINTEAALSDPEKYRKIDRKKRKAMQEALQAAKGDHKGRTTRVEQDALKMGRYKGGVNPAAKIVSAVAGILAPILRRKGMDPDKMTPSQMIRAVSASLGMQNPDDADMDTPSPREVAIAGGSVNASGVAAEEAATPAGVAATSASSSSNALDTGPAINARNAPGREILKTINQLFGREKGLDENVRRQFKLNPSQIGYEASDPAKNKEDQAAANNPNAGLGGNQIQFMNNLIAGFATAMENREGNGLGNVGKQVFDWVKSSAYGVLQNIGGPYSAGDKFEEEVFADPDYVNKVGYRTKGSISWRDELKEGENVVDVIYSSGEPDAVYQTKDADGNDVWEIRDVKLQGQSSKSQQNFFDSMKDQEEGVAGKYVAQQIGYRRGLTAIANELIDDKDEFVTKVGSQDLKDNYNYKTIRGWFLDNEGVDDAKADELTKSLLVAAKRGRLKLGGVFTGSDAASAKIVKHVTDKDGVVVPGGFEDYEDQGKQDATYINMAKRAIGFRLQRAQMLFPRMQQEVADQIDQWRTRRNKARNALANEYGGAYGDNRMLNRMEHAMTGAQRFLNKRGQENMTTYSGVAKMLKTMDESGAVNFSEENSETPGSVSQLMAQPGKIYAKESGVPIEQFIKLMHSAARGSGSYGSPDGSSGSEGVHNQNTGINDDRLNEFARLTADLTTGKNMDASYERMQQMGILSASDLKDEGVQFDADNKISSNAEEVRQAFWSVIKRKYGPDVNSLLGQDSEVSMRTSVMPVVESEKNDDKKTASGIFATLGRIYEGIKAVGASFTGGIQPNVRSSDPNNPMNAAAPGATVSAAAPVTPVGPATVTPPTPVTPMASVGAPATSDYTPQYTTGAKMNAPEGTEAYDKLESSRHSLIEIAGKMGNERLVAQIEDANHSDLPHIAAKIHDAIYDPGYRGTSASASLTESEARRMYAQNNEIYNNPEVRSFFEGISPTAALPPGAEELEGVIQLKEQMEKDKAAAEAATGARAPGGPVTGAAAAAPGAAGAAPGLVSVPAGMTAEDLLTAIKEGTVTGFNQAGTTIIGALQEMLQDFKSSGGFVDSSTEAQYHGNISEIEAFLGSIILDEANPENSDVAFTVTDVNDKAPNVFGSSERKSFGTAVEIVERLKRGEYITEEQKNTALDQLGRMRRGVAAEPPDKFNSPEHKKKVLQDISSLSGQIERLARANSRSAVRARKIAAAAGKPSRASVSRAQLKSTTYGAKRILEGADEQFMPITTSPEEFAKLEKELKDAGFTNTDQAFSAVRAAMMSGSQFNDEELHDIGNTMNRRFGIDAKPIQERWGRLVAGVDEMFEDVDTRVSMINTAESILRDSFGRVFGKDFEVASDTKVFVSAAGNRYRDTEYEVNKDAKIVEKATGKVVSEKLSDGTSIEAINDPTKTRTEKVSKVPTLAKRFYDAAMAKFKEMRGNMRGAVAEGGDVSQKVREQAGLMAESEAVAKEAADANAWGDVSSTTPEQRAEARKKFVEGQTEARYQEAFGEKGRKDRAKPERQLEKTFATLEEFADEVESFMNSEGAKKFFGADGQRILSGLSENLKGFKDSISEIRAIVDEAAKAGKGDPNPYADAKRVKEMAQRGYARANELDSDAEKLEAHLRTLGEGNDPIRNAVRHRISNLRGAANTLRAAFDPDDDNSILGRAYRAGVFGKGDQGLENMENFIRESNGARPRKEPTDPIVRLMAAHQIGQMFSAVRHMFSGDQQAIAAYSGSFTKSNSALAAAGMALPESQGAGYLNASLTNQQLRAGRGAARAQALFNGIRGSGISDVVNDVISPALGLGMMAATTMPAISALASTVPALAGLSAGALAGPVIGGAIVIGAGVGAATRIAGAANDPEGIALNQYISKQFGQKAAFNSDWAANAARGLSPEFIDEQTVREYERIGYYATTVGANPWDDFSVDKNSLSGISGVDLPSKYVPGKRLKGPAITDPTTIRRFINISSEVGGIKAIADYLGIDQTQQRLAGTQAVYATGGITENTQGVYFRAMSAQSQGEDFGKTMSAAETLAESMGYYGLKDSQRFLGSKIIDRGGYFLGVQSDYTQDDITRMMKNIGRSVSPGEAAMSLSESGLADYKTTLDRLNRIQEELKRTGRDLTASEGLAIRGAFVTEPSMELMARQYGFSDSKAWQEFVGPAQHSYRGSDGIQYLGRSGAQYQTGGIVMQASYGVMDARRSAGLKAGAPDEYMNLFDGIVGEGGQVIGITEDSKKRASQSVTAALLGKSLISGGFAELKNYELDPVLRQGFGVGNRRQDSDVDLGKTFLSAMGFNPEDGIYSEEQLAAGSLLTEIASSARMSSIGIGKKKDAEKLDVMQLAQKMGFAKNVNGAMVVSKEGMTSAGNIASFIESGSFARAASLGFDTNQIMFNMAGNVATSSMVNNVLSFNPLAFSQALMNPTVMDLATGGKFSRIAMQNGFAPIVSPDTGGALFARDMSGLNNPRFGLEGRGTEAKFLSGAAARDPNLIGAALEPMQRQLFGPSQVSASDRVAINQSMAGFKYTDPVTGQNSYYGGIAGLQLQSNQWQYQAQMGQLGIQLKQLNYNRERQLAYDFPLQLTNNEIQTAAALGGVVHTDWMKKHGIDPMDFSGGTILSEEMKGEGMKAFTYEGGRIGLARFNLKMDKLDLIKGQQANRARMGWQFEDIARESYQAGVRADWQREDFGMQGRQMALARQSQAFDFSYQAREMGISRQQFREDVAFQQRQRQLQFGWQMEDADINIRRATGFERRQLIKDKERGVISFNMETEQINRQNKRQEEAFAREEEKFKKEIDHYQKSLELEDETFKKQQERFEQQRDWEEESFAIRQSRAEQEAGWSEEAYQRQLMRIAVQEDQLKKEADRENSQKQMRDVQYQEDFDRAKTIYDLNKASLGIAIQAAQRQKEISDRMVVIQEAEAKRLESINESAAKVNWDQFAQAMKELRLFAEVLGVAKKDDPQQSPDNKRKQGEYVPKAFGGKVNLGSTYLVGELGAEILNIGRDGQPYILPNSAIPKDRSIGRSEQSEVIHIHVMMDSDEIATYTAGKANNLATRNRRRAFNG